MESSGSKKKKSKDNETEDEDKKTLSQQVAEGKYGLIQKELFSEPVKKFGVLSYDPNPEVPKDTIKNLGGLTNDDIWLAEDHLLILKGGIFPGHSKSTVNWPPIDNYKAPRRQVKIPNNPKIPPPFPVQLSDDGPIELIGPNGTTRALPKGSNSIYPQEGYIPGTGPFFPSPENNGETPFPIPPFNSGKNFSKGNGKPFPFPPQQGVGLPPFISSLPPNAVYLPPPSNQTDIYDEDDPSIYYPPPYSFYYPKDNKTEIPAGPLVPGIILPPPPDFFGSLEPSTRRLPNRTRLTTSAPRTVRPTIKIYTTQIVPTTIVTTTPKPIYVPETNDVPDKIRLQIPEVYDDVSDSPELNSVTTPTPLVYTTQIPVVYTTPKIRYKPDYYPTTPVKKTKLYPQKITTTPSYDYDNSILDTKPVYGPPKKLSRVRVSTTAVPLKAFYTTEIQSNSVTNEVNDYYEPHHNTVATRASPKFKPSAEFYYYEEPKTTTARPYFKQYTAPLYYDSTPRSRPIYQEEFQTQTVKPESINNQILRLQQELQSYLTSPRYKTVTSTSKPVYQYSFQAAGYVSKNLQNTNDQFRPIVGYNPTTPTTTTPQPSVYNYQTTKTYDYDYEAERPQPKFQNFPSTENPVNHYYTKHDEGLIDDITKQYFTMFGQKITGGRNIATTPLNHIQSTTPIPPKFETDNRGKYETENRAKYVEVSPNVEVSFGDNSQVSRDEGRYVPKKIVHSLESDILVNYRKPRPLINPNSEYIPGNYISCN